MDSSTSEDRIKDLLAADLSIIDKELKLIEKEYRLDNSNGAKGFVDILAMDAFNNLVIIEIKRSQASSREAIQEILKYVGLIKQNFKVRDSSIRVIIISTHWKELLIPYSELCYQSALSVTGLQLSLARDGMPMTCDLVQPLKLNSVHCGFARRSVCYLFKTLQNRDTCIKYLIKRCGIVGLTDFVMLPLTSQNDWALKYMNFTHALVFAFRSASLLEYEAVITMGEEEIDMTIDEFDYEDEYKAYVEEIIFVTLQTERNWDSMEAFSPERLDGVLLQGNWKAEPILRFGIFSIDPRYLQSDDLLLRELRGLDGTNRIKYQNFTESTQTDRLTEIEERCLVPLQENECWKAHLQKVFGWLHNQIERFRLVINIYHPTSIFDSICRISMGSDPDYLPTYLLFVDFLDTNKLVVFYGKLVWSGKNVNSEQFLNFLQDDSDTLINKFTDSVMGHFNEEMLSLCHLYYDNYMDVFQDGKLISEGGIRFTKDGLEKVNPGQTFYEWVDHHPDLVSVLAMLWKENICNY